MPYPNEHACRIGEPRAGADVRRKNGERDHEGKKYDVIYQRRSDGEMEEQAYRYPKDTWEAAAARAHCASHDGSFEAAATAASWWEDGLELKEAKREYLVIPKGKFEHPQYGKLDFNDGFLDELVSNFEGKVLGETKPFIDQDHDQRGAAGWFVALRKSADGLIGTVEWTEVGLDLLKKRIYRYFSPTISSYTDPQSGKTFKNVFRGGALTNLPFLKMLPEITLDEKPVSINLNEIHDQEDPNMGAIADVKKKLGIEEKDDAKAVDAILAKIDELTKLAESGKVSGDQATKLQKELDEIKKKLAEKDKGGDKSETEKKAAELESKLTEVVASNKTLAEKLTVMERDKCITKALSEGRMLPEKRKFYEDLYMESPALVGKAIDAMPVVIELKAKGNPNDRQPDDITDEERALHRRLGHTDEDIKKYRE